VLVGSSIVQSRAAGPNTSITLQGAPSGHVILSCEGSLPFLANGRFRGSPGERVGGWRFGFIQLKHITTEWAVYRGTARNEGSILAAMDRPPARTVQLCRDRHSEHDHGVFYNPEREVSNPATAWTDSTHWLAQNVTVPDDGFIFIEVSMGDEPGREYPLIERNTRTTPPRDNYLYQLESRAAYICVLVAQEPGGNFHFLKHCYWNVHWQATLNRTPSGTFSFRNRSGGINVQARIHSGEPNDARFRGRLTAPLPNCNQLMRQAFRHPRRLRCSPVWQRWHVGR